MDEATTGGESDSPVRIGAVSYLNTLPLIEGLEKVEGVALERAAPSRLIEMLLADRLDVALAPVIESQRTEGGLALLPVGVIGSDGPTLTVRLYSAGPIEKIERVDADTDSRTSIVLMRALLRARHGIDPAVVDFDARERISSGAGAPTPNEWPEAMLLIGDKVVTSSPPAVRYPHQMDLGEAWKEQTGLPFVYAVWMCRPDRVDDPLVRRAASVLDRQRRHNRTRLDWIVTHRAPELGWPTDLARDYLGRMLRYEVDERARESVERFFDLAREMGLLERRAPTRWAGEAASAGV